MVRTQAACANKLFTGTATRKINGKGSFDDLRSNREGNSPRKRAFDSELYTSLNSIWEGDLSTEKIKINCYGITFDPCF